MRPIPEQSGPAADLPQGDSRKDLLTQGGQHLQTPSPADQHTAAAVERMTVDLADEWQVRALCNELHVAKAEIEEAVRAVGMRWPAVRDYLQGRVASSADKTQPAGDGRAAAGPPQPGLHGENVLADGQMDQMAAEMPRKAKTGQAGQEQAQVPHPASRE